MSLSSYPGRAEAAGVVVQHAGAALLAARDAAIETFAGLGTTGDLPVEANPALVLGAAIGGGALAGLTELVLVIDGTPHVGIAEQVAELVRKTLPAVVPVVVAGPEELRAAPAPYRHVVLLTNDSLAVTPPIPGATVSGPLDAQLLCWQAALAIAVDLIATTALGASV